MKVTTSNRRLKYVDYMSNARFREQVHNTMDRNMALGLYAFLFLEGRDLDRRELTLHRAYEYTTQTDDPEYIRIHGEILLTLSPDEDGGDIE